VRIDLEDPARLVAGIPERVPLVTGLEGQIARLRVDDVVAQHRPHPARLQGLSDARAVDPMMALVQRCEQLAS
jgi:hypothetical protein